MKRSKQKTTNLLSMQGASIAYAKKEILPDFDFHVNQGEFACLTGKSGSGKSSILYVLAGLLKPTKGSYTFNGKPVYGLGEIGLGKFRKENIGFLFQDFRLLPFLTLEQNIHFPILFSGKPVPKKHIHSTMEMLGIAHRAKAYPREVSGGEAQRAALARALILHPKLLLLDEPTGNLDESTEKEILNYLITLQKSGLTLLCVTHSNEIMKHSNVHWHIEDQKIEIKNKSRKWAK